MEKQLQVSYSDLLLYCPYLIHQSQKVSLILTLDTFVIFIKLQYRDAIKLDVFVAWGNPHKSSRMLSCYCEPAYKLIVLFNYIVNC